MVEIEHRCPPFALGRAECDQSTYYHCNVFLPQACNEASPIRAHQMKKRLLAFRMACRENFQGPDGRLKKYMSYVESQVFDSMNYICTTHHVWR
jgi:hypothetical protein